nr:acyl-CoA dehydrogenase family protein [Parafrankia elaeagni]
MKVDDPTTTAEVSSILAEVIRSAVDPQAREIDQNGAYPRAALRALGDAGLLGVLSSRDVGGLGLGLRDAVRTVEALAGSCASTAMVVTMHLAATAVIEAHGPIEVRRSIAAGDHISTLAFSELGSRSHFWAPLGTATAAADGVELNGSKSWVTSAGEADSYVWSSRPVGDSTGMTLWLVPAGTTGLAVNGGFDGVALRGNASRPMAASALRLPESAMIAADGAGLEVALAAALPTFLVLSAACSLGLVETLLAEAATHLTETRLEHLGVTLAQRPASRAAFAKLRIRADEARAFLADTLVALETGRPDATLRVLQVKAVAAEAAAAVGDGVLRLCGGSALRRERDLERHFRDSLAARVMAPTTEALHDFVGRACLGLPLLDEQPAP